ncbi:MAG: fluoride efflux transporter CrcB [Bacteroidetes bacterium SW_9_63_38]|nr:MAG: fluoride efflux transporter CrcB [Bacteroidetes bacterium SW_9_63_38]
MPPVVFVALGGACGAMARYGTGRLVASLVEHPFPWGTWTVNLLGCFLIGMTVPLFAQFSGAKRTRFFLVVGFVGSFTTFSTFSLDTVALWDDGHGWLGLLNTVGSLACGLVLVAAGREVSAWLLGG